MSLAACGEVANTAAQLSEDVDAAIDEKAAVGAAASAVDVNAAKAHAEGAARDAIRDALPTEALAPLGAVVNEDALVEGIDKAIDGQAITAAVRASVKGSPAEPAQEPAER